MAKLTQAYRAAAVGTPLADDLLLLKGMAGYDTLSQPFNYSVDMLSEDPDISFEALIGENITVRLNHVEGGEPRYFNGIVADLRQLEPLSGLHSYQALVVPWLWFLKKSSDSRIFQQMKVPDILTEVFKLHGFEDFELRLSGTYPELEYCVQYRETDFAFVSRLMEEVGIYYFFTHEDGKHTMVLADARAAHDPCPGFDTIKYIGPTGNATGPNEITRWEQRKQVVSGGFALTDFNFAEPKKQLYPTSQNEMQHNLAAFEQYQYEGEYTEDGGKDPAGTIQFDDLAKVRLQALQSEHAVGYAESDCRGLQAGHTFTLTDCFRKDQNGGYFITSIHHQIVMDDYVSGSGASGKEYICTLTAISDKVDYRPLRVTPKPRVAGPQTAFVVGRSGEEIDTDEFGRVKVQFHWDRESKADETSSCWVRVSQNWAGKKWGAMFIPRIGQEVVVDFLEGDPDRPIITGRVYNGDNMPPYELPAEKTKSTIKSHSSKDKEGFNEMRFDDKAGKEQIFMHAEKDMDIRVKNNYKETNYGHRHIRVGWEKDGECGGDFNTLVRHDENRHIEKKHYEKIDEDSHQTVSGERTENFEKSKMTRVKEQTVLNTEELIIETGTLISEKTKNMILQGESGVHVKGSKIIMEADSFSFKSGGNFITIGSSGVDIKGMTVNINSGGSGSAAESPKDLPEIEVLHPLDARVADNDKSGGVAGVRGRTVTRGGGVLSPILAPEYTPPKPKPPKPPKEPEEKLANDGLCVDSILFSDLQSRYCNSSGVLEVVPKVTEKKDLISFEPKGKKECGCAGPSYTVNGGSKLNLKKALVINAKSVKSAFQSLDQISNNLTRNPEEKQLTFYCDATGETIQTGTIRQFESDVLKVSWNSTDFLKKHPQVKSLVEKVCDFISKITGRKVDPEKGLTVKVGSLFYINYPAPEFKFEFSGKWEEFAADHSRHWEAYYGLELVFEGTLFKFELKFDIVQALSYLPSLAPFKPIYDLIWEEVVETLGGGNPPFYISLSADLKGQIGIKRNPDWNPKGGLFNELAAAIGLKIESGYLKADMGVSTSAENGIEFEGSGETVLLQYGLFKFKGAKGKVNIVLETGWFGEWGYDKECQIFDGSNDYFFGDKKTLLDGKGLL